MNTRNRSMRCHAQGAVRPATLAVLGVLATLALGAWFLVIQPHEELMRSEKREHFLTPVASGKAPPPANVDAMDTSQLLSEARKAYNQQRYLAPAGNNAFEYYLRVLQRQPGNTVATDALRETFPFAASAAEQSMNNRDFNEAQRQIDLLAKADPTNYTVTILRSKLDAQRKTQDKEQQQLAEQQKVQQLAAQKAAQEKANAEAALAAQQKSAQQVAEAQHAPPPRVAPHAAPLVSKQPVEQITSAPVHAVAEGSTDPVLIRNVQPRYPAQAQRSHLEGWVDVGFTIDTQGNVTDLHILESQPNHVFDYEAQNAVRRWKYTPAMRDGNPVAVPRQQRIQFKQE